MVLMLQAGRIKITLNSGDDYGVTSRNEVTIQVNNHVMETPAISIANAPEISPTNNAEFTLISNVTPRGPISISYRASETGSNFLGTTTPTQSVIFTQQTSDHPISGILTIPTVQDANNTSGTITVTIIDDTDQRDYILTSDTSKRSATVQIKTTTLPTLSIQPSSEQATEGGTAKYIITASRNPANPLMVKWSRVEVTGNFLNTALATQSTETRTDSWNFTQVPGGTAGTYELTLHMVTANEVDEPHGKIRVTLDPPESGANYRVAEAPNNSIIKTVYDAQVPLLTISPAPEIPAGFDAKFTITSDIEPTSALKIRYTPTNDNQGNFLDPTLGGSGIERISDSLTFTPTGTLTEHSAILTVPTIDDPNLSTGSINVELEDDVVPRTYRISATSIGIDADVNLIPIPIPELSLNKTTATTADEGQTAMVQVTTDTNPLRPLPIKFTPTELKGDFLDTSDGISGFSRDYTLNFSYNNVSRNYIAMLPIDTRNSDNTDTDHGNILIELDEPDAEANYTVAAASKQNTVIVYDDSTPLITVTTPVLTTIAGNSIMVTLNSDIEPWQDIPITFIPTETSGTNFLDTTGDLRASGISRTSLPLKFDHDGTNYTATLIVPTVDDPNATSGSISVEIQNDSVTAEKPRVSYRRSPTANLRTATVSITAPPAATDIEISIANITTAIKEGDIAEFEVSSMTDPKRPLSIKFTPSGSFLDTTDGTSGTTRTQRVTLTRESGATDWTGTIMVPTRAPNGVDEAESTLTVTLDNPSLTDGYVRHSTNFTGVVSVKDADAPIITIENAPLTIAGNMARFTLTASFRPIGALTIKYRPENTNGIGDFLDSSGQIANQDWMKQLTFTSDNPSDPYTSILEVPTQDDATLTAGSITVTLKDDTSNSPKLYTISAITALKIATVSVIDRPNPSLTITAKERSILEGDMANFVITANKNPINPLSVKYTPTENAPAEATPYLDSTHTSQVSTSKSLTFRQIHSKAPWTSEIQIPFRTANGNDEPHADFSIVLANPESDAGYTIENSKPVNLQIFDVDIPVITISNANTIAFGNNAEFTLTSDIKPWQPVKIRYTVENQTGNFLDTDTFPLDKISEATIPFTPSNNDYIGTLSIPTIEDTQSTNGTIKVTLIKDDSIPADYLLRANLADYTATVRITRDSPEPTLEIIPSATPAIEGGMASFLITSNKQPPGDTLNIKYSFVEGAISFLHDDEKNKSQPITEDFVFTNDPQNTSLWTAPLNIQIRNTDNADTDHGSLTVTLDQPDIGAKYLVTDSPRKSATRTIYDLEIPEISIANATETLAGNMAKFTLSTTTQPWKELDIRFTPAETTGNFLDTTNNSADEIWPASTLEFSRTESDQPYTATLLVPTVDDPNSEAGMITITLADDDKPNDHSKDYTANTTPATASVIDVPVPVLSIADVIDPVTEGNDVTFVIDC